MLCWSARKRLADESDPSVEQHLSVCSSCREEHESLTRVSAAVGEAGCARDIVAPADFEQRLLAAIRSVPGRKPAAPPETPAWRRPEISLNSVLPVAASVLIMVAAGLLATLVGSGPAVRLARPRHAAVFDADGSGVIGQGGFDTPDRLLPPREIPFTLREDLVGARRGRIPGTTYVLEPAPHEPSVMRASL